LSHNEKYSNIKVIRHITGVLVTDFNPALATIGFFIGGAFCFWVATNLPEVETWIRFPFVIAGAGIASYLIGKFGNALLIFAALLFCVGVIAAMSYLIWGSL
jgi:hypothetical protein